MVTFIPHFKIKFPTPNWVDEVKGDLNIAQRCYRNTLISSGVGLSKQRQTMAIEVEPFKEGSTEPLDLPAEETEDMELILGNSEKIVKIGSGLEEPFRTGLVELLRVYGGIFTWVPSDIHGIDESVAIYKLCVDPSRKSIR